MQALAESAAGADYDPDIRIPEESWEPSAVIRNVESWSVTDIAPGLSTLFWRGFETGLKIYWALLVRVEPSVTFPLPPSEHLLN